MSARDELMQFSGRSILNAYPSTRSELHGHLLWLLLLDLLHVLLEEELVNVHHVDLPTLDVRLLDVRHHVQRRSGRDQQRGFLAHLE